MAAMKPLSATLLALAAAAGLAGSNAWAGDPARADPPPPASLAIPDVEAWASAYLTRDAWTLITHDTEGARFARPQGGSPTGPHSLEADIRTELFQPVQMGSGAARSGLAHWSVDCATARYQVIRMVIFSHNNLLGELGRKAQADETWMTPNESQAATIGVICKAVMGGTPLERRSTVGAPAAS